MTGTRAPARDSSLRDRKAPGNVSLTHPAAPRTQCSAEGTLLPAIPGETVNSLVFENDRAQPWATLPLDAAPLWLSFLAMPSIRSAAEVKAATMAAWVAWLRSAAASRTSCRAE